MFVPALLLCIFCQAIMATSLREMVSMGHHNKEDHKINKAALGLVQSISLRTSICPDTDCGMTGLGQLDVKICAGDKSMPCCAIVNIANFGEDGALVKEGEEYQFNLPSQLEDCNVFSLNSVSQPSQIEVKVYHEGTDGAQFDWIRIGTTTGKTMQCNLGLWMNGQDIVTADTCQII